MYIQSKAQLNIDWDRARWKTNLRPQEVEITKNITAVVCNVRHIDQENNLQDNKQTNMPFLLWKYDASLFQFPWISTRPPVPCKNGPSAGKAFWSIFDTVKKILKLFCHHWLLLRARTDSHERGSALSMSKPTR